MGDKIKSIEVFRHDHVIKSINSEEVETEQYKYQLKEFDEAGNELLEINYTPDGNVQDKTERLFDDEKRLIEEKYYDGEDLLAEHRTYQYNEEGKAEKEFLHYLDGSKDTIYYSYDENGHLKEKKTEDEDAYVERQEFFINDPQGRVLKHEIIEEEEVKRKDEYERNQEGEIEESRHIDNENMEEFRLEHAYENGQRTATRKYDATDQLIEKYEYRNEDDRVAMIIHELPGEKNITQFAYDDKGNIVKQEEFDRENTLLNRVERQYNKHGDVTESKTFINLQGRGIDRNYFLKYSYAYHD